MQNGRFHIGHLAGCYLPADIFVRFLRLQGSDVLFVCGSDEHGVPITLKARNEGISPQQVVDKYHHLMKDAFAEFGISFDIYSRTSAPVHHETARAFFLNLYEKGELTEQVSEQYFDGRKKHFLLTVTLWAPAPTVVMRTLMATNVRNVGNLLALQS